VTERGDPKKQNKNNKQIPMTEKTNDKQKDKKMALALVWNL